MPQLPARLHKKPHTPPWGSPSRVAAARGPLSRSLWNRFKQADLSITIAQKLLTLQGERISHTYAEASSNTRHCASKEATSSGTRINNTLSHEACSSRALSSLSRFFAASV